MIARLKRDVARRWWFTVNRTSFARTRAADLPCLLVDVSTIVRFDAQTGIQRVVRAVWSELLRRNGQGFHLQPVFASYEHGYVEAPLSVLSGGSARERLQPAAMAAGDQFLGLDFTAQYLPACRQQLRAWRAAGASVSLIVYDLLPLSNPEWFSAAGHRNYRRWFSVLTGEADRAVCISETVAGELKSRTGGRDLPAISTIKLGGDIESSLPSQGISPEVERLIARLSDRAAILMVGTVEPRKGHDAALRAFEYLWTEEGESAPDLVIVGKPGWKTEGLQRLLRDHPEAGRRLHWLPRVSDEELCRLYEASRGFLMASRGEGMGLPLVEAAMHRRPILARDLPVFREQALPGVTYFHDERPAVFAQSIRDLLSSMPPTHSRISLPCWRDTVDQLLEVLGLPQAG